MTLNNYIAGLLEFVKDNPNALELRVITSKDDEGNGYNDTHFGPTLGHFDETDFTSGDDLTQELGEDALIPNAVCVN